MGLYTQALKYEDYESILVGWWSQWGWVAPKRDFLPNDGTGGFIVYDNEVPVCAGFMYTTNSKVSWVDWIISNKEYTDRGRRKEAIKLLIYSLTEICKFSGSNYTYALIKNESLIKTYKDLGYIEGSTYTKEMIKIL